MSSFFFHFIRVETSFLVNQTLSRLDFCLPFTHTLPDHLSAVPQTTGCVRAQDDHSLGLRLHQKVNRILLPAPADCHCCSAFFLLFFSVSPTCTHSLLGLSEVMLRAVPCGLPHFQELNCMVSCLEKRKRCCDISRWVKNTAFVLCWGVGYDLGWQRKSISWQPFHVQRRRRRPLLTDTTVGTFTWLLLQQQKSWKM